MAINDETFEFALTGHPFEGVYDAYLGVSAPINADITLATFTVSITINGLDVQRMENNILELLDTWVDLGLQVLKDSEEDLKVNEETLQEYQNYLCTDDCPKLVTCVTDFSKSCQKQLFYDCTTVGDVCSSPEYTCTDTETICLDETCESTVDACQFWEQTCEIYSSGGCDEFSVITIGSECLESIVSCETDEISDEECQKECEFNQLLYDDFEEYYESLVAENEETQTELKGFESLQGIKLAEIHSISSVVELNKSGVDTSDVTFTIEYSAYSLVEDKLVDLVATHKLNFYGEIKNDLKMFEIIKGYIIDNSDGSLSEELIRYSPLETSKNN